MTVPIDRSRIGVPNTDVSRRILLAIAISLVLAGLIIRDLIRRRIARRVRTDAASAFREARGERAIEAMRARIAAHPENPVGWFLLGCGQLRSNRVKDAARAFGMAYHQDVEIEAAALLTFACLKARDGAGSDILDQMVMTWREMREPNLAAAADRHVLATIGAAAAPKALSTLGRLAWAVTGDQQRAALQSRPTDKAAVWNAFYR